MSSSRLEPTRAEKRSAFLVFTMAAVITTLMRIGPHEPNFTPVGALFMLAGFLAPVSRAFSLVCLAIMLVTDWTIGFYDVPVMASVYLAFGAATWIGKRAGLPRGWQQISTFPFLGIASALTFFVVTNGVVWLAWYKRSWVGFVACYTAAIPFLRGTVAGDVLFSTLFGAAYLAGARVMDLDWSSASIGRIARVNRAP